MDNGTKIVHRIFLAAVLLLFPLLSAADVHKGKRYYMKYFKQKFKMSASAFSQLHTREEWERLFDDQGRGFIAEFAQAYPKQRPFLTGPGLSKKLPHLRDFAIEYAKDSGNIPTCGEESGAEGVLGLERQESSSEMLF
jgi:hypothetical protein